MLLAELETKPFLHFSAVPGIGDPLELRLRYQANLLKSLRIYLTKINESLRLDLSFLIKKISSLKADEWLSPHLFVIYSRLKSGYEERDLTEIFDALHVLASLDEATMICSQRSFDTILTESWEASCIEMLRQENPHDAEDSALTPQMLPLFYWPKSDLCPPQLDEAISLFEKLDGELHREFDVYVTSIKLFAGRVIKSVTSVQFFGSIYLRLPYPNENALLFYLEHLVHEVSHLHLFTMMGEDSLILNHESELFSSPLRVDQRPMSGIFHAAFVLSRIVRIYRRYCTHFPSERKAEEFYEESVKSLRAAFETIQAHAKLTKAGESIYKSMEECAFDKFCD